MEKYERRGVSEWMTRCASIFLALMVGGWAVQCGPGDLQDTSPHVGMTLQELALENTRDCSDLSGLYPQELIDGLSMQLIDEMRCMDPGWLEYYTPCKASGCIWANGPQPLAARPEVLHALRTAAASIDDFITINAAYRDVAMQYFSRWRTENCDANFPAAIPGRSNHQGGRAIDVQSFNYWWDILLEHGFEHPLPNDRPHFEFKSTSQFRQESEELKALSILAFQVLWNKNHPNDLIDEDGLYGPQTKQRLGSSPIEGFPISGCADPEPPTCESAPCGDGCDPAGCAAYCDVHPCGEGCPIEGCGDLCDDDPCAEGCNHAECPGFCEDFPCDTGCNPQQCAAFCLRNPCDPQCGEAACDYFCEKNPCAEACEGSETCVTPDPDPCRDEACEDGGEPTDPIEPEDPNPPEDPNDPNDPQAPAEPRRANQQQRGCSMAGDAPRSWAWLVGVWGTLWMIRHRRTSASTRADRKHDAEL